MYLWNDIAKADPDKWFVFKEDQSKTLDNLLDNFEENASSDSLKVFADDLFGVNPDVKIESLTSEV